MSLLNKASLIQIPSGYKDGTLYSAKPTNGDGDFTFSRGSNLAATRVNSDGLIEKGRENLLLQSNQFNTTWTTARLSSLTSGQSGYDGSNDAWSVIPNTANDDHKIYQSVSQTGIITFSVYAKANGYNGLALVSSNTNNGKFFNLSNGTLGNDFNSSPIDSTITEIGNGWYRCQVVFNVSAGNFFTIYVSSDGTSTYSFSGNETDGILIQSAQIEVGLVSTPYIETGASTAQAGILEDMPRLDYSGGATCGHLLLEPQRSNLVTQSEYFDGWANKIDVSLDFGYLAPDGTNSAYKVTSSGASPHLADNFGGVIVSGVYKSIWAKTISGTGKVNLLNHNSDANTLFTITNEWQRFDIAHTSPDFFYAVDFRATGATLSEVLIWGAQAESGSYPTSYIPTYGASVTRGNDVCKIIGANATDLVDIPEMTFFAEHYYDADNNNTNVLAIARNTSGGTYGDFYSFIMRSDGQYMIEVRSSNTSQAVVRSATMTTGNHKIAAIIEENNIKLFVDGVLQNTDTNATLPTGLNELYLGGYIDTTARYGTKKSFVIFPTALSDDECIQLTTL